MKGILVIGLLLLLSACGVAGNIGGELVRGIVCHGTNTDRSDTDFCP